MSGEATHPGESITRSSALSLATQLTTAAFTAGLTLYLVRALGPSDYGVFALAIGIGTLLILPSDFGISSSTARFIAEHRGDDEAIGSIVARALRLKLAGATVVCGALFALAGPIADAYDLPLAWPLRGIALAVFGQNLMMLFAGGFIASRRVASNLRLTVLESSVETGASLALVLLGAGTTGAAMGRAAGYLFGAAAALVLGARAFGWAAHARGGPGTAGSVPLVRYAAALFVIDGAFTLFEQIDVLLLGAYLNAAAVGVFQAPLRLVTFLSYAGYAIANGVAPRMARSRDAEPAVAPFLCALRYIALLQSLMIAPLVVWARPIVELLLGDGYHRSIPVIELLAVSVYLAGFAPLVSLSVNYLGAATRRVPLVLGAAALNVVIDVILIPRIGVSAGAIGTGAAYVVLVGGHLLICRRLLDIDLRPLAVTCARGLLAAAAMAGVLLILGTHPPLGLAAAWLVVGIAVFAGVLVATGEVTRAEVRALRRA